MGANSSKASNNSPTLDDSKAGVFDKDAVRQQPLHRGPIHCVCSVGETTIASGGADKVSLGEFSVLSLQELEKSNQCMCRNACDVMQPAQCWKIPCMS